VTDIKRRGRPCVVPGQRKDHNFTFRTRADLRDKLNAAAAASGRTATAEVELRVEASFHNEDLRAIIREEVRAALAADREAQQTLRKAFENHYTKLPSGQWAIDRVNEGWVA
jgi:hypothetical protein